MPLNFTKVERSTPFSFHVLNIAKSLADFRNTFAKFAIGWDKDKVVGTKAIGNDHFHCSRSAARNHDDFVSIIAFPRIGLSYGR